jgi:hypothetical protein
MTPEEYFAFVQRELRLTKSRFGNVWFDEDGQPHHVPDPYKIPYDRRREILEEIRRGIVLP